MRVVVSNEGELPGLEELLSANSDLSPSALVELKAKVDASEIPVDRVMGLSDTLQSLIDWIRRRRLIQTLPEESCRVTWFELHVPEQGSASLSSTTSTGSELSIDVSLFGSGFGRGCKAKLSVTESTDKYAEC